MSANPLVDATLAELRELLEKERSLNRQHSEELQLAKDFLLKHGFNLADLPHQRQPKVHNLTGVLEPSLIKGSFEDHFNSMAATLNSAKSNSETTIRIKNFTFKNKMVAGSKTFPTVAEALTKPIAKALGPKQEPGIATVLDNVSTFLEPGKCYLILGPPKSGKTSLLKAIAGRLLIPKGAQVSGEVTYNGDRLDSGKFDTSSVASFVEQLDIHEPYMTVRETFQFAGTCNVPIVNAELLGTSYGKALIEALDVDEKTKEEMRQGKDLNRPDIRAAVAKHRTGIVLSLLGLKRCADTIVGNEKVRGVSGGERRRVTLGEMLMGTNSIGCFDEISTGLDSAATYDIIRMISAAARAFKYTACISLLQPPPEVFDLFDEVLVMREGRLVYQGPVSEIKPYMAKQGYPCPSNIDTADYLVELNCRGITPDFLVSLEKRRELGVMEPPPRTAYEFQRRYQETSIWAEKAKLLMAPQAAGSHTWKPSEVVQYANNWMASFHLCAQREWCFFVRDKGFLAANLIQDVLLALVLGTIYYQIGTDEPHDRFGATYAMLAAITAKNVSAVPIYFDHRSVFYKQKNAQFFHTSAFAVAGAMVNSIFVLLDTIFFGVVFYFLSGFSSTDGGEPFFMAMALITAGGLAMQQFFRSIAFLVPDQKGALSLIGLALLFLLLFSGYITSRENVPSYWLFAMYSNPIFYLFQGLCVTEFLSSRYPGGSDPHSGIHSLNLLGLYTDKYWAYIGVLAALFISICYFMIGLLAMEKIEHRPKGNVTADEEEESFMTMPEDDVGIEMPDTDTLSGAEFKHQPDDDYHTAQGDIEDQAPGGGKEEQSGSSLTFTPMTLAFHELVYTVTLPNGEPIDLLKGIDAYFKPGTMTALMGSSGAGKTTLLDVIAGRKTSGQIKGDLYVNGSPIDMTTYSRVIGYVEQMDLHSPLTSVKEALEFSARLRLSSTIPIAEKDAFVKEVLDLLELTPIQDEIVGLKGEGLSTEQRKRLTIGVELVANPSLIFLDEPTSGLDSRAALIVIRVVKKLAQTGRTIICTIHQPSLALFQHFDDLLLLKRGGQTVFFGPLGLNSINLVDYLEAVPGSPPFKQGENPATWMLECIGAGTGGSEKSDYAAEYKASSLVILAKGELLKLIHLINDDDVPLTKMEAPTPVSWFTAAYMCIKRSMLSYNRMPTYNLVRPLLCFFIAFVLASVFGPQSQDTYTGLYGFLAVLYLQSNFVAKVDSTPVIDLLATEKPSFARERFTKMYPVSAYALAWALAEIPWIFLQSIVFAVPFYFLTGYDPTVSKFLFFFVFHFLYNLWNAYLGQFLSGVAPTAQVGQVLNSTIGTLLLNFAGFTRNSKNIPIYWKFLYWALPSHYALEGMVTTQWHDVDSITSTPLGPAPKNMIIFDGIFAGSFKYDDRWVNVGALLGCCVVTIFGLWASLRFLKIGSR